MLVLTGILGTIVNLPIVNMKAETIGPFGPMFFYVRVALAVPKSLYNDIS